jgi:hypothetical protein
MTQRRPGQILHIDGKTCTSMTRGSTAFCFEASKTQHIRPGINLARDLPFLVIKQRLLVGSLVFQLR